MKSWRNTQSNKSTNEALNSFPNIKNVRWFLKAWEWLKYHFVHTKRQKQRVLRLRNRYIKRFFIKTPFLILIAPACFYLPIGISLKSEWIYSLSSNKCVSKYQSLHKFLFFRHNEIVVMSLIILSLRNIFADTIYAPLILLNWDGHVHQHSCDDVLPDSWVWIAYWLRCFLLWLQNLTCYQV